MSRRRAFKPSNGYDRCWTNFLWARASPVGLKYCSLAVDDNRYVSNETNFFARDCYDVFTIPCAVILLLLFRALSDLRARAAEEMRPKSCWDDSRRCSHHSPHVVSKTWRTLEMLQVPSTMYATLPAFSYKENHWHLITILAGHTRS